MPYRRLYKFLGALSLIVTLSGFVLLRNLCYERAPKRTENLGLFMDAQTICTAVITKSGFV
jgi:hypothetical protein